MFAFETEVLDLRFEIQKLVLWPRDQSKEIRVVEFQTKKVNIITGDSGTGKSSLISIIDYCLGSAKCTIPVGTIREKCEWFGVLIQLAHGKILLARREPGEKQQSIDMMMFESDSEFDLPKVPTKNCNLDAVKDRLNELCGLSSLSLGDEAQALGFGKRASFRDLAAFQFQPQHIVANPYTLFYKADTYEHREKLKYILPYVLDAVSNETLLAKHELERLEKEYDQKLKQLEIQKRSLEYWLGEIKAYYAMAEELGLISESRDTSGWSVQTYVSALRVALASTPDVSDLANLRPVNGASSRLATEIKELYDEEADVAKLMSSLQYKLSQIHQLKSTASSYSSALAIQQERTQPIGWFIEKSLSEKSCPFCDSKSEKAIERLKYLSAVTSDLTLAGSRVKQSFDVFDTDILEVQAELRALESRLAVLRRRRSILEGANDDAKSARQNAFEVYRFIGRLEQALMSIKSVEPDGVFDLEVKNLGSQVFNLKQSIRGRNEKEKLENSLSKVSAYSLPYARIVGVENSEARIFLNINNLTLKIMAGRERDDYLWEIGSGANWMGYHLAFMLALHRFFCERPDSSVPNFIIFDQPSQVYFPEEIPLDIKASNVKVETGTMKKAQDIVRVNQIFKTISKAVEDSKFQFQVIVIDHADANTWEGIEHIHLVERWRDGAALIPRDWQ